MASSTEEIAQFNVSMKRSTESSEINLCKKTRAEADVCNEDTLTIKDDNEDLPPISEEDVGICKYIGEHKGFRGILKERYSDFIVNEVTPDGAVVRLTHFDLPRDEIAEANEDELRSIIGEDLVGSLFKLKNGEVVEDVKINVSEMEKNDRRKIHESIRKSFRVLNSSTQDVGTEKFIVVSLLKKGDRRNRSIWPSLRPDYTHFVMYKENRDTMDAINSVAGMLCMKPGAFTYAGTKDKRAKSSQMVSVYRVEGQKLIAINRRQKNITIGNIQYKKNAIALGDLAGNHFVIVLRKVSGSEADIGSAVASLKHLGFINYYGMQRFGTNVVPTHHVGRTLISGKWKDAVELILKPRDRDDENMSECRKIWWETKDASKALDNLHKKGSIEGQLLKFLSKQGNNWIGALDSIPRNTRLIYLHSYQSWIWNQLVSKRIEKHGLAVLVGDLVLPLSEKSANAAPRIATQEESEAGSVSVYDVVLPLPGYKVHYPANEVAEWYKEILATDGLDLESFKSRIRSYSLGGTYRHLIVRPENVSWELLHYDDTLQPLALSDRDIINGESLPQFGLASSEYLAVKLQMNLPSSSYATMAVRELMKNELSFWSTKPKSTL